jgi:hypothetical protein
MTKIRNVEQLYDTLSRELSWRIKELDQVQSLVRLSAGTRLKQDAAIRAGITLMYAHWEGFIKQAATAYLNFVNEQKLDYNQLAVNFVALSMKSRLHLGAQSSKATIFNGVAEFFLTGLHTQATIPWHSVINTKSNLSSSVFKEIVVTLGLDYTHFETKENLIDESLLWRRNNIAHGEFLEVGADLFFDLFDEITNMMKLFRNLIDNAATSKAYVLQSTLADE